MRLWIVALSLLAVSLGLVSPLFQKVFVDRLLGAESAALHELGWAWLSEASTIALIGAAAVCTFLSQAVNTLCGFEAVCESLLLQARTSERLYRKMLSIRSDALGSTTVGEVVSIYAVDVPGSTAMIDQALPLGAGIVFPFIFAPLAIHWIVGIPIWATFSVILAVLLLNIAMSVRQARFFLRYKQLAAERTGVVNEWVQNLRLLRILGWVERFERKIFTKRIEETGNRIAMVTNGQMMGAFGSSISFVINVTAIATLVYVRGAGISPGELFALLWILGVFLARPFRQIPWIITFSIDSLTSIQRIERYLARPSDKKQNWLEARTAHQRGEALALRVRGMNLAIGGTRILQDINLDIEAGEFVAVIGEVGSGKSSMLLSLLGETGATFDEFKIGDRDAKPWSLNERRTHFGFVAQDGFVMSASIRENVAFRYDVEESVDVEVAQSLKSAQFDIQTEALSHGLDTEIGERGVNLSGGQRQRVSLARARYFSRPILLLDDCLSAVDVDTEAGLIADLINGDWKKQTRILVTHRLSVLPLVDRVFYLQNGRIVAAGNYEWLMRECEPARDFVTSVHKSEAQVDHVEA